MVLTLAVWLQASSWSSGAHSSAHSALFHAGLGSSALDRAEPARGEPAPLRSGANGADGEGAGDCDAPEDSSGELSAMDDSFGSDVMAASVPNWFSLPPNAGGYAWVDGLAPGGPPADAPFKPPRA